MIVAARPIRNIMNGRAGMMLPSGRDNCSITGRANILFATGEKSSLYLKGGQK
jgi:hypothetical protein